MQIAFNFLSPLLSISNSQWKLFIHLSMKLISRKMQKHILQIIMFWFFHLGRREYKSSSPLSYLEFIYFHFSYCLQIISNSRVGAYNKKQNSFCHQNKRASRTQLITLKPMNGANDLNQIKNWPTNFVFKSYRHSLS
jgi:hypothetical protein